jgi:hypothetical protein
VAKLHHFEITPSANADDMVMMLDVP